MFCENSQRFFATLFAKRSILDLWQGSDILHISWFISYILILIYTLLISCTAQNSEFSLKIFLVNMKQFPETSGFTHNYLIHLFLMHHFSTPWKHQGVEKGCIRNKWVNKSFKEKLQNHICAMLQTISHIFSKQVHFKYLLKRKFEKPCR